MKIRLIDVDGKIPNYALMKISTFHKIKGDDVDWYNPIFDYEDTDIIYISKIFTFTNDYIYLPKKAKIIKGGTGYNYNTKLPEEIEKIKDLDYSLYPNHNYSIIFTARGCIRECPFCIVSKKEGKLKDIEIANLNPNGKYIMILDNNFFASNNWKQKINILKKINQPIDFNTGIDLRILTEEQCKELKKLKIKNIHCAWDNYKDKDIIIPKLKMLTKYIKPYKITCYVLIGYENKELCNQDIERVNKIWEIGVYPFVMVYMDFNNPNYKKSKSCKDFARWCNNRYIFKSCKWEEYNKK